ncbi:M48 family metalloprotease [bacterium]|nr:M48 family metalloprotease [bacterium]
MHPPKSTEAEYVDGLSGAGVKVAVAWNDQIPGLVWTLPGGAAKRWPLPYLRVETKGKDCFVAMEFAPGESLKVSSDWAVFLKEQRRGVASRGLLEYLKRDGWGPRLIYLTGFSALCIGAYLLLLPVVADAMVERVPQSIDDQLGKEFFEGFVVEHPVHPGASQALTDFAGALGLGSSQWKWYVVDEPVMNAFALPDGSIVVYSGLLEQLEHSSELAGLLGHETAHVKRRHAMRMLARRGLGSAVVGSLFGGGIAGSLAQQAEALGGLSYSRRFELESDREAQELLLDKGLDARGMVRLLERLEEATEGNFAPGELFSTHPHPNARIEALREGTASNAQTPVRDEELERKWAALRFTFATRTAAP